MLGRKYRTIVGKPVTYHDDMDLIFILPVLSKQRSPGADLSEELSIHGMPKTLHCKPKVPVTPANPEFRYFWSGNYLSSSNRTGDVLNYLSNVNDSSSWASLRNNFLNKAVDQKSYPYLEMVAENSQPQRLHVSSEDSGLQHEVLPAGPGGSNNNPDLIDGQCPMKELPVLPEDSAHSLNIVEYHSHFQENQRPMAEKSATNSAKRQHGIEHTETATKVTEHCPSYIMWPHMENIASLPGKAEYNFYNNQILKNNTTEKDHIIHHQRYDYCSSSEENMAGWNRQPIGQDFQKKKSPTNKSIQKPHDNRIKSVPLKFSPMILCKKSDNSKSRETSESRRIMRTERYVQYLQLKQSSIKPREKIMGSQKHWKPVA